MDKLDLDIPTCTCSPTLGAEQEPSDTGAGTSSGTSVLPTPTSGVCPTCLPVLSKYKAMFKELTHRGSSLKRVKHVNPNPTSPNVVHYRDVKRQNEWLRENVFEQMYKNFISDDRLLEILS